MRKHLLHVTIATTLLGASLPSLAMDQAAALDLAKKSGCLACHSIDKKIVGPAWKDVSAKYQGNAEMKDKLIAKVKAGGKGNWGEVPMPPYSPRVSDADIESLVTFVLSLADKK
jgi:cytochrome c